MPCKHPISTANVHQAAEYVLGPLNEPQPSELDGPGSSFLPHHTSSTKPPSYKPDPSVKKQNTGSSTSTNPFRRGKVSDEKTGASTESYAISNPTNGFRSTRTSTTLPPQDPFPAIDEVPVRRSTDNARPKSKSVGGRPRRTSSLSQRYPGDKSHQPLDQLRKEDKAAHRSPHLRKQHQPRPDSVDQLDKSMSSYHHESPYDAALLVRNSSYKNSPIAALGYTNEEALKATPHDKIKDSLHDHRPLDGTAIVPPGHTDEFGQYYDYEEGTDMMRECGANYKRWPGIVSFDLGF